MHKTPSEVSSTLTILGRAEELLESSEGCPLYMSPITAGTLQTGEANIEERLDLHAYCVSNPPATFFLRVEGDAMLTFGIHPGDLLIVDRSAEIHDGRIVIAVLNGELTVKRLQCRVKQINGLEEQRIYCTCTNADSPEIDITHRESAYVWGVVTHVLHRVS